MNATPFSGGLHLSYTDQDSNTSALIAGWPPSCFEALGVDITTTTSEGVMCSLQTFRDKPTTSILKSHHGRTY